MTTDTRFDDILKNFGEHQQMLNTLRRTKILFTKIFDTMFNIVSPNPHILVVLPVGADSSNIKVVIRRNAHVPGHGIDMFLSRNDCRLTDGTITLDELRAIFENPNPIIDAAARYCAKHGKFETFAREMARFNVTRFNL